MSILKVLDLFVLFCFRFINYDERDFFLCNVCGFCKYVKFDYMLIVRFCCVVDFIENEEDCKKVIKKGILL